VAGRQTDAFTKPPIRKEQKDKKFSAFLIVVLDPVRKA
jgi:hypothetical protein